MRSMRFDVRGILTAAAAAATLWGLAAPAGALITSGGCVNEVSGANNVCTANDVTFVAIGLGQQEDGCVNNADTVHILLGGTVANTTAQTRYDIGLYVAVDGDPNGDGALTGTCAREILTPAGVQGVMTCNPATTNALDLLRLRDDYAPFDGLADNGYYLNVDGDTCGDLNASATSNQATGCDEDGDGVWDDTKIRFSAPLSFPCDDVDANGFIEIPTCATWGNQNNQVGGTSCDSEVEAVPGTKSKCNCQVIDSTVPAPNLSLACSSPSQTLTTNSTGTFSVTFTNNIACTPDLTMPEREQCGTASYVFYQISYDPTLGTVSNIQITRNDGSSFTGTVTNNTTTGVITWIPVSSRQGTAGILGSGDSATLTYDYTYTSTMENVTISNGTTTYWTNNSANLGNPSASGVTAQSTLSCTGTVSATPVSLSSVQVVRQDGAPVLTWTTATEAANVGFNVYADTPDGWHRINDQMIVSPAIDSTAPEQYSFDLSGVDARQYMLEDVALDGTKQLHGPYIAGKRYGHRPVTEKVDWQAARTAAQAAPGPAGTRTSRLASAKGGNGNGPTTGGNGAAPAVRLLVDTDGVQRVTYEDLLAAGFDFAGVPASQLALSVGGHRVPIRVESPGGSFGPGGYVEFIGQALDTLYTRTNVYDLTRDPQTAERIPEDRAKVHGGTPVATYQATERVERDNRYSFASPGDDPWYDTRMVAVGTTPRSTSFTVDLDGYVAGAGPVDLAVDLWGVTTWPEEGDHHAVALWNGTAVGDLVWDAETPGRLTATLPANLVQAAGNQLTIELAADRGVPWDVVDLESYSVTYPRSFEARGGALTFTAAGDLFEVRHVADAAPVVYRIGSAGPELVTGVVAAPDSGGGTVVTFPGSATAATYRVATAASVAHPGIEAYRRPDGLLQGPAEYLVISHRAFLDGLGPLVAAREAQGLSVKVVDVQDVYDRFADGVIDPEAIHAYITEAAKTMGTRYVLLVGGDTYDYQDNLGLGSVSFIPSLYAPTGNIVRYAPVDPLYADVDGDRVPDLGIGRLPVRTPAELDAVISKILAYEGRSYGGTALVVADARDEASGFSFSQAGDAFAGALGSGWSVQRAYIDAIGAASARQKLFHDIDQGVALTSFIGHSGLTHWTFSGVFGADDVAALDNSGAPTVVLQWGCWNTYHVEPHFNTLGHRLLLTPDRGAATVLGSATLLETTSAQALSERLAPLLAQPGMTLGDAVTAAKQELAASHPEDVDAILGWTLLGDPALVP